MSKRTKLLGLAFFLLLAGTSWYFFSPHETSPPPAKTEPPKIIVYVCGSVKRPGVVELSSPCRVHDAIKACGDLTKRADATSVNMALPLNDGDQIEVKEKSPASINALAAAEKGKVNINTADEKALDKLPGIGPSMAKHIIEHREKNGPFKDTDALKNVRGIGAAKLQRLQDFICV